MTTTPTGEGQPQLPPLRRNRDFRQLWIALASMEFGSNLTFIAMPLLVLDVLGTAAVGAVSAAAAAGSLVTLLAAGALVDRLPRRTLMLACVLVRAVTLAVGTACLVAGTLGLLGFMLVSFSLGASFAAFRPAETASLRIVVDRRQWPQAFSRNQVRGALADITGTAAGGVLYSASRVLPFVVDLFCAVGAILGLRRIRADLGRGTSQQSPIRDIADGARYLARSPVLRVLLLAVLVANFASYWPAFVVLMQQRGVGAASIGLIATGIGLAGLAGGILAPPIIHHLDPRVILPGCLLICSVSAGVLGFVESVPLLIASLLLGTAAVAPFAIVCDVLQARSTDQAHAGRVSAMYRFVAMLAVPAGQALGTFWLEIGGPRLTFTAFALPIATAALLLGTYSPFWRAVRAADSHTA